MYRTDVIASGTFRTFKLYCTFSGTCIIQQHTIITSSSIIRRVLQCPIDKTLISVIKIFVNNEKIVVIRVGTTFCRVARFLSNHDIHYLNLCKLSRVCSIFQSSQENQLLYQAVHILVNYNHKSLSSGSIQSITVVSIIFFKYKTLLIICLYGK